MPREHVTFRTNMEPIKAVMAETGVTDKSEALRVILSEALGRGDVMRAVRARLKAKAAEL